MTNDKLDDADGATPLSLYLYFAAQTEKLIERRNPTSRYFLTINAGFVAILGLALQHKPASGSAHSSRKYACFPCFWRTKVYMYIKGIGNGGVKRSVRRNRCFSTAV